MLRGRPAHRLRRAGAERGRLPVDPEAGLPGRRADRRHGGLPQRAQDQGHAHRDEVRHGRGRGGVRRRWRTARSGRELDAYPERLQASWVWDELLPACATSARPSTGACGRLAYSALDTYVLRGKAPWTLRHQADHETLKPAAECQADRLPASPTASSPSTGSPRCSCRTPTTRRTSRRTCGCKDPSVAERVNLAGL